MLMCLTAWQVLLQVTPQTAYEAQIQIVINQLFLTTDPSAYDPPEIGDSVTLYNIEDVKMFAQNTINNYYDLSNPDNTHLDVIEPIKDENGKRL